MAWCGIWSMVILLIGLWAIAGFVPPPSPGKPLVEIAHIYADHALAIRIGLIISCYGATLLMPWAVAISSQMRRIEGDSQHPLATLQMALGVMLVLEFLVATMFWQAAAFRPLENPEITARLHDIGGIMYVGVPMTTMLQAVALGIAIMMDTRENPIFPRWLAYFSFWAAVSYIPGSLNPLAHHGPLAYDGVLAWWLGLIVFSIWIAVVSVVLIRRSIPHQRAEEKAAAERLSASNAAPA
jgi:hypothetical protein